MSDDAKRFVFGLVICLAALSAAVAALAGDTAMVVFSVAMAAFLIWRVREEGLA